MRTHPSAAFLPFIFLFVIPTPGFGQSSSNYQISNPDSVTFFLYVDYCGSSYNKRIQRQEMVINVVKLPVTLLEKMPRLRNNGQYSSRNLRISAKQQEVIRKVNGEKMIVRVNKKKFNAFYPKGLKKGFIIEKDEFNRWNFQEKTTPVITPPGNPGRNRFYWYWYETDPVNINYGLMIIS
ncbi:MAG: hypothetical protein ACOYNC_12450 [Bacteroidales bacterium]